MLILCYVIYSAELTKSGMWFCTKYESLAQQAGAHAFQSCWVTGETCQPAPSKLCVCGAAAAHVCVSFTISLREIKAKMLLQQQENNNGCTPRFDNSFWVRNVKKLEWFWWCSPMSMICLVRDLQELFMYTYFSAQLKNRTIFLRNIGRQLFFC